MSGYFTSAQIQAKLDNISTAIDAVLSGGKSYNLNDGQGTIQVTRETLATLEKSLNFWEKKLGELEADDNGSNFVSVFGSR